MVQIGVEQARGATSSASVLVGAEMSLADRTSRGTSPTAAQARSHGRGRCCCAAARRAHRLPGLGAGRNSGRKGAGGSCCPLQPPVQLVAPAASPGIGLPARFQRTRVDCLRRSLVICSVSTGRRRTNRPNNCPSPSVYYIFREGQSRSLLQSNGVYGVILTQQNCGVIISCFFLPNQKRWATRQ